LKLRSAYNQHTIYSSRDLKWHCNY